MQQIDDVILLKVLGKGAFGEVYLSQKQGRNEYFATKKIDRKIADKPSLKKYLDNEISILSSINHPNIVKLEGVKRSASHHYIIMEYINGGGLSDCLKKYKEKYNKKAFPEEIVQYLMRQIIDALNYIHKQKIIHRDLKLDNIMINFDSESDMQNLNMMKAKIKIIDFGFATKLSGVQDLTFSAVGSPINMDPIILAKFSKNKDVNKIMGYDEKADIWSIGTVCYELLTGKAVFNAKTMNDLEEKVKNGSYSLPKSVSKEVMSFLNAMLQYDSKFRLSAEELLKHPFLTKNVSDFKSIAPGRTSSKQVNFYSGKNSPDAPIPEERQKKDANPIHLKEKMERRHSNPNRKSNKNEHEHEYNNNQLNYISNKNVTNFHRINTMNNFSPYTNNNFYGQNLYQNSPQKIGPQNNMGMPMMQQPINPYGYGGMYPNQMNPYNPPYPPASNNNNKNKYYDIYKGTQYENDCLIQ